MKKRLVVALVGLAIGFAVPALAQEQSTVDPEVRQPDGGLISGREAIVKAVMGEAISGFTLEHKIVQMYACGNDICAITEWSLGHNRGRHAVTIYVRDADDWKIRIKYVN
jgi:hypothetical protein